MKRTGLRALLVGMMMMTAVAVQAQVAQIVGDWCTVDDKTGETFSIVRIYKGADGKYYGKIAKMLVGEPGLTCVACTGEDAGKQLEGLVIIRGFEEKDGKLVGGRVLDPDNGKFYYGKIYLKNGDLVLRGSLDKAGIFGRSQTWKRKK